MKMAITIMIVKIKMNNRIILAKFYLMKYLITALINYLQIQNMLKDIAMQKLKKAFKKIKVLITIILNRIYKIILKN